MCVWAREQTHPLLISPPLCLAAEGKVGDAHFGCTVSHPEPGAFAKAPHTLPQTGSPGSAHPSEREDRVFSDPELCEYPLWAQHLSFFPKASVTSVLLFLHQGEQETQTGPPFKEGSRTFSLHCLSHGSDAKLPRWKTQGGGEMRGEHC